METFIAVTKWTAALVLAQRRQPTKRIQSLCHHCGPRRHRQDLGRGRRSASLVGRILLDLQKIKSVAGLSKRVRLLFVFVGTRDKSEARSQILE